MSRNVKFVYTNSLLNYHFHENHPFNQQRVLLAKELLEESDALASNDMVMPRSATEEEIALFHDVRYIDAVKNSSKESLDNLVKFGLGTEDTPVFPNMHEASMQVVGATLTAVESVLLDGFDRAVNFGGGLHHGYKNKASGFCVYNDAAIAINYIRKVFGLKVLYIDTDAHHGDGVQWAFYEDPNVCTFSIHETGRYLFPGTGNVTERGIKAGHGFSFNLPIDAFTQDDSFIDVYSIALQEIADYFQPDIIVTQNGADAHFYDPLSHLCGSMEIYEAIPKVALEIANRYCNGKWIALGGGGYDIWRVVPRAWAQLWHVMKYGDTAKGPLPLNWVQKWQVEAPVTIPTTWKDDKGIIPEIPRKAEITEKNYHTLLNLLKYTKVKRD